MKTKSIREQCWDNVTEWAKEDCRETDREFIAKVDALVGLDGHVHVWGSAEEARFTGNPHRKCTYLGCKAVSLDFDDE